MSPRILLMMGYYVPRMHRGVAAFARQMGWQLNGQMAHNGRVPAAGEWDGIISFHNNRDDIVGKIVACGVPTVDMSNGDRLPELPRVWHDNVAIGRMAGEYLVSRGFQDVAYVFNWEKDGRNNRERAAGLRQAVETAGRRFYVIKDGQTVVDAKNLPRPLAIMAQNDEIGVTLIHQLREAGLRVPQDVAVIGADDDDIAQALSPVPLTSVDDNVEHVGYAAAELLAKLLEGAPPPSSPVLIPPTRVVERESTNLATVDDMPTARALALMRSPQAEKLSIAEIARRSGICRRRLDDRFKQLLGEPVSRHQARLRIEKAKERLAVTNQKMEIVAAELGFSTAAHFCTAFRQWTGCTPTEFRRRAMLRSR